MKPIAIDKVYRRPTRHSMSNNGTEFIRPRNLGRPASENALCTQSREQRTSALPLDQRQPNFRLLAHRGGESDLQGVLSSYTR
jgi:hypothetical protein